MNWLEDVPRVLYLCGTFSFKHTVWILSKTSFSKWARVQAVWSTGAWGSVFGILFMKFMIIILMSWQMCQETQIGCKCYKPWKGNIHDPWKMRYDAFCWSILKIYFCKIDLDQINDFNLKKTSFWEQKQVNGDYYLLTQSIYSTIWYLFLNQKEILLIL